MKKNPYNIASPFFRNNKFKLEEGVLRNTSFKISNNIYGIRKNPDRFLAFHFKQCFCHVSTFHQEKMSYF